MEAGRELDALVAEKVMGWTYRKLPTLDEGAWVIEEKEPVIWESRWKPSIRIKDAWLVVEKMIDSGFDLHLDADWKNGVYYYCEFSNLIGGLGVFGHEAETAPLAICLAALKAVGVEAEDE
ncbi:hypothetical protein BSNK01_12240 [Bacillaceae bacterium]